MAISVRIKAPERSKVSPKKNYRKYKEELRLDFNTRCGYCDDQDEFFGGARGYHIDHFAPKSLFKELSSEYTNLVYSCPFCNGAKSNKWIGQDSSVPHNGNEGFIDPCETDFDNHLYREVTGIIAAKTDLGRYMIIHLKLGLARHQLIWQAQKLDELSDRYDAVRDYAKQYSARYAEFLEILADINTAYKEYRRRVFE